MTEQLIPVRGVELCASTFGSADDPAVVLVAGSASSMDWWEEEFCERIAARGRFVIRYDHRDTGRSVLSPPGEPAYTGTDLVDDVVGVLDHYGVSKGHVVGVSMGGGIALTVAVRHPSRVASLALLSTSAMAPGLPSPAPHIQALFASPPPPPDWGDREAVIGHFLEDLKAYAGTIPGDEEHARRLIGRSFDRTKDFAASQNHWILGDDGSPPLHEGVGSIACPTVVLHGTEDPLFPYGHGEALAAAIPGARLIPLEGVGHEMPPPQVWDVVVDALVEVSGR